MLITYISKTGNVDRFIKKLPYKNVMRIETGNEKIAEPFIFVTYTTGIGQVPEIALDFCSLNHENLVAVAASGNRNWGNSYAIAADKISNQFNVPVLMKFELSGRSSDVEKFIKGVEELALYRIE